MDQNTYPETIQNDQSTNQSISRVFMRLQKSLDESKKYIYQKDIQKLLNYYKPQKSQKNQFHQKLKLQSQEIISKYQDKKQELNQQLSKNSTIKKIKTQKNKTNAEHEIYQNQFPNINQRLIDMQVYNTHINSQFQLTDPDFCTFQNQSNNNNNSSFLKLKPEQISKSVSMDMNYIDQMMNYQQNIHQVQAKQDFLYYSSENSKNIIIQNQKINLNLDSKKNSIEDLQKKTKQIQNNILQKNLPIKILNIMTTKQLNEESKIKEEKIMLKNNNQFKPKFFNIQKHLQKLSKHFIDEHYQLKNNSKQDKQILTTSRYSILNTKSQQQQKQQKNQFLNNSTQIPTNFVLSSKPSHESSTFSPTTRQEQEKIYQIQQLVTQQQINSIIQEKEYINLQKQGKTSKQQPPQQTQKITNEIQHQKSSNKNIIQYYSPNKHQFLTQNQTKRRKNSSDETSQRNQNFIFSKQYENNQTNPQQFRIHLSPQLIQIEKISNKCENSSSLLKTQQFSSKKEKDSAETNNSQVQTPDKQEFIKLRYYYDQKYENNKISTKQFQLTQEVIPKSQNIGISNLNLPIISNQKSNKQTDICYFCLKKQSKNNNNNKICQCKKEFETLSSNQQNQDKNIEYTLSMYSQLGNQLQQKQQQVQAIKLEKQFYSNNQKQLQEILNETNILQPWENNEYLFNQNQSNFNEEFHRIDI